MLPRSFLAAVLVAAACTAPPGKRETFTPTPRNVETRLQAAELQLQQSDPADAAEALAPLAGSPLEGAQRTRYQLIQAELALAEGRPLQALQLLPPGAEIRDAALVPRAEEVRARALFMMGDAVGATQLLVARERHAADESARGANRDLIWNGLSTTDLDTASGLRLTQADAVTRGWVELALISRSVWLDPRALTTALAQWQTEFPGHPARDRAAGITAQAPAGSRRALEAVALLLPLSGAYAATGEAVRDGFFSAYYATAARRPAVRVYDTGATTDSMLAAWREALDDGAEFVVGPLKREDAMALAREGRQPVPVLALNYLDETQAPPFNFFQWGLSPDDEARQAAERAVIENDYRAVALVPEGDWGARVLRAFQQRFEALGGKLVAAGTYAADARDHSEAIRALLALTHSAERHRALTATLGVNTEFEPRRRGDVHTLFIAGRPEQARLLAPQLRFHRAGDLPVYATSSIYDGDVPAADLNGLRFCDMPWMFAEDGALAALRSQLRTLFPARGREYTRLLALGHDAYTLVALIDSGQLVPGSFFPAGSGTLSLRADGAITRGLACAEIRNGKLRPLDSPDAS